MKVTLTCQLELLMLVEMLCEKGFILLVLNTDGAEFYVDRTKEDLFMFKKFWPECIAKSLTKLYANSEKSNEV